MWKVRAFNAQGSRVNIVVVCTRGAMKIYVAAVEVLRKYRMKLSIPSKLVEKLVWVPVILLCKIFILSYMFQVLLCRNWPSSPPNRGTLTLVFDEIYYQGYILENFKFTPFLVKFTPFLRVFLRTSDYMQIKFECVCPTPLISRWRVINKIMIYLEKIV